MRNRTSLVSAIIPTKNRADLLERAMQSVLAQTYRNLEVVVVNDGSTDSTRELLSGLKEEAGLRLKVINNETSMGAAQARNQAIKAADGKFIAGLDDDDTWHEQRIEKLLDAYSDEFCCITSNTMMVYPKVEVPWRKKEIIDLDTLFFSNQVGNQALIKRDRLLKVGGFDSQLQAAQDYDLWVRLCEAYGPVYNVQEPLQRIYINHQKEQITNTASFYGYLQFYNKHKHRMNRKQRKYQLYNIRRAQSKPERFAELLGMVPPDRYAKEIKRWVANRLFD